MGPDASRPPTRPPTGTKYQILQLLAREELTPDEIAERLGVSGTAARQHLATLDAVGLLGRRKDAPATGRPAYRYRLSQEGRAALPKRYDLLLELLVDVLEKREGEAGVAELLEDAGRRLADRVAPRFEELPAERRWTAILDWLEEEFGWEAETEETGPGGRRILIHQCPFQAMSLPHPALCGAFFQALLAGLGAGSPQARNAAEGMACCVLEGKFD